MCCNVSIVAESEDSQNTFCCGLNGQAWTCVHARHCPWADLFLVTSRCAQNIGMKEKWGVGNFAIKLPTSHAHGGACPYLDVSPFGLQENPD